MKVAVIGSGISGLVSAYVLVKQGVEVVLYEKEESLGGHARTLDIDGLHVDLGFIVLNPVTYPNTMELFENLGVELETSDMSFSVSLDKGKGYEWGVRHGWSSVFANKLNFFNPKMWKMLGEINKLNKDVKIYLEMLEKNPDLDRDETLEQFIKSRKYSELFLKAFLVPVCCLLWSCPTEHVMSLSAFSVLSHFNNQSLLQLSGSPQWLTCSKRSHSYVNKVKKELESRGCHIKTGCGVNMVTTEDNGCVVSCEDGTQETYDKCIIAVHAPDALRLIENQATFDEKRLLGAYQYLNSDIYLHHDKSFMPKNPALWSALNYMGDTNDKSCLTYWLNVLQNLGEKEKPFLLTINPDHTPESTLIKWSTGHVMPSVSARKAILQMDQIQGKRGLWFCGAYLGYGYHEDGVKAGLAAAHDLLGTPLSFLKNPKHMMFSLTESKARIFVSRFLNYYISIGTLILLEEGGTALTFDGKEKTCPLKVVLKVHTPQFYWKLMTQADLGLADAYINGDFSFVDKDEGLLHLLLLLIANRDLDSSKSSKSTKRGWWSTVMFTASITSAQYFLKHFLRQNTLTQARRNISRHYDLSNELFGLFLDETMTYSTGIFKSEDEDLKDAQLRKLSSLIKKARINENHEVLEIGCGWGSFAIEVVRQTGCKYTGITLSQEQLNYAEQKVKEAGLQDRITFKLCDYRELAGSHKFDRIISCEMLEHVGHEFMGDFFRLTDSVLADDGVFVLQFISIPEERYDQYRRSSDFIKEYIFPGGSLPSLNNVTSAMASASKLSVEHVENIGLHYHQTLRYWRKNFLKNQSKIIGLGFDEKFVRTWEYYFDYCAAGFKSLTLGDYQIVFSRPGNVVAFGNQYASVPSVCCI